MSSAIRHPRPSAGGRPLPLSRGPEFAVGKPDVEGRYQPYAWASVMSTQKYCSQKKIIAPRDKNPATDPFVSCCVDTFVPAGCIMLIFQTSYPVERQRKRHSVEMESLLAKHQTQEYPAKPSGTAVGPHSRGEAENSCRRKGHRLHALWVSGRPC